MAYRLVYSEFWRSPKVLEEMTPEDRLFYLYVLTNPNTTMIGIYKITKKQIAFELGYSMESVNSLIERFEKHHKLISYNSQTRELAIKNWGKYNFNKGGKPVLDCIRKDLKQVEDVDLVEYVKDGISNTLIKQLFEDRIKKEVDDSSTSRDTNGGTTGGQYLIPNTNTEYLIPIPNTNTTTTTNIDNNCDSSSDNLVQTLNHFQKCNFIISPMLKDKIESDIEIYGVDEVVKAAEIADENGKHTYSYVKGILEKRRANIDTGKDGKTQETKRYNDFDLGDELL